MNFWSILYISANLLLCIRLLFFSDRDRQASRWVYRLLLFLVAIYVGRGVILFIYHPGMTIPPMVAIGHMGVLIGALLMRPEYLPGNCSYDTTKRAYRELGCTVTRWWHGLWSAQLHGGEGKPRSSSR